MFAFRLFEMVLRRICMVLDAAIVTLGHNRDPAAQTKTRAVFCQEGYTLLVFNICADLGGSSTTPQS